MKLIVRAFLTCLVCLIVTSTAFAQENRNHPPAKITGVYGGDFTVGAGSGDLEGMRIVIVNAGDAYHAIVQVAEGGAQDPDPKFVPVKVTGMTVEIGTGDDKLTGTISAAGLRIKEEGGTTLLKRKPCSTFL